MKRIEKFTFFIFLLIIFLLPANLFAWGSATHAYISKQLCQDNSDSLSIYGSVVPDFFNQERNSAYFNFVTKITHYNLDKIKKESNKRNLNKFALGFISHNEKWGSDLTAHKKARTNFRNGYASGKGGILAPFIEAELENLFITQGISFPFFLANSIASEIAHPLIEVAVDLQIKIHEDEFIGSDIKSSAIYRTAYVPDILISAYANDLSKKYKISRTEASDIIRNAENSFCESMIQYGEILNQEYDSAIQQLAEQGTEMINYYLNSSYAKGSFVTPEIMKRFIELAIEKTKDDYFKEISETIKYLKKRSEVKKLCKKISKTK